GGREHGDDTEGRGGRGRVDRQDLGTNVGREVQRGVQRSGHAHVVDVVTVTERQFAGLVFGARAADGGRQRRLELLALGNCVDRFQNFDVTGAAAQVGTQVPGHVGGLQVCALL